MFKYLKSCASSASVRARSYPALYVATSTRPGGTESFGPRKQHGGLVHSMLTEHDVLNLALFNQRASLLVQVVLPVTCAKPHASFFKSKKGTKQQEQLRQQLPWIQDL